MKRSYVRNFSKRIALFLGAICCLSFVSREMPYAEEVAVTESDHDVTVSDNDVTVSSNGIRITVSDNDVNVIPDLYNTGATEPEGGFAEVSGFNLPCTIDGEPSTINGEATNNRFVINLQYKHKNLNGTIVIENVDLSAYTFTVYNASVLQAEGRQVSFVFNNCKLRGFAGDRCSYEGISYTFNNCSFVSAYGSDATFNHCRFGGGISDRLNLFVNCFVNDCYIYNPTSEYASEGEIHVDGIQIYGNNTDSTIKTENIHFDNCRFEMPSLRYAGAPKAYVNACIMLQTEFSDGENISFENCYVNGGGYAIYAHGTKGTRLSEIVFKDLHFGCAARYGRMYPDKPEQDQVEWNEDTWEDASSVYVGTVKRDQEKNETYLSVSNDTNQKRYFRAYTSGGRYYDYAIDACPTFKEFSGKGLTFEDFPFDRLYTIPEYCDWVVVYEMLPTDNSTEATMKQVRFQNWTEKEQVEIAEVSAATLEYDLAEDGTLTINGFGNMPEFTSEESIPWYSRKEEIKQIVIKGVTSVSKCAFAGCENLEEVVFPEKFEAVGDDAFSGCIKLSKMNLNQAKTLKTIGKNAFFNCISLSKVALPESIVSVGSNAFSADMDLDPQMRNQTDVYYDGTIKNWLAISFANEGANPMYLTGGNLYVNGSHLLTELDVQSCGITVIKSYAFAGCTSLSKVNFAGVTEIGSYAFVKSAVGGEIVIPETVKKIGTYACKDCFFIEKVIWESSNGVPMGAFQNNTKLKELIISGSATDIFNWAFKGCTALTKVTLPDTMTRLAQQSFQNCVALQDINIPGGVTSLGNFTFAGCTSLEKIKLPDTVSRFDIQVFAGCTNLKEVRLSKNLTNLGDSCFSRCSSLETIELPEALTSISSGAFNECSALKSIRIPVSVTEIKTRAFYRCGSLASMTFMGETCPAIALDACNFIAQGSVCVYIPENAAGYTENAVLIKIVGHLYSTQRIAASSCVSPGKEHYTCLLHENCDSDYEKTTQAGAHQPGEPVLENVVAATVEKEGSCDEVYYCIVCKTELRRESKTIEKLTGAENGNTGSSLPGNDASGEEGQYANGQGDGAASANKSGKVSVKSTALKKVVKKKNKMEVTWIKRKGISGYEIQYSTNKNFKKGVHIKRITKAISGKTTIRGFKKNKKYYVRIRTYKKVNGKKYVSKWSKKKSVKM